MAGIAKPSTRIGTAKICPFVEDSQCVDDCEWFDGEGCAVWRIVKALEKAATALAPMERR